MPYPTSPVAQQLMELLRNARVLAVRHQKRTLAADVTRAAKIFAKSHNFPIDETEFDKVIDAIPGKMNPELTDIFKNAEMALWKADLIASKVREHKSSPLTWADLK